MVLITGTMLAVLACGSDDDELFAADFDQSCVRDEECTIASDLAVRHEGCEKRCLESCRNRGIRKSEKASYDAARSEMFEDCNELANSEPGCSLAWVDHGVCVQGKCEAPFRARDERALPDAEPDGSS